MSPDTAAAGADDPLLALLEAGKIRGSFAYARAFQPVTEQQATSRAILAGWEQIGPGNLDAVSAIVRPLVTQLDAAGDDRVRLAHALLCLGAAALTGGDRSGAVQLERAITLHDGPWLRAQALRYLAWALETRGAYTAAAARYDAAAALYTRLGDAFGAGSAGYGAAAALDRLGQHEEAERRLRDAITLLRTVPGPALATALGLLAGLLAARAPAEAEQLLEEAGGLEASQPLLRADLLVSWAMVERARGLPDAALERTREAASLVGIGSVPGAAARTLRGACLLDLGRVKEAEVAFAEVDGAGPTGGDAKAGLAAAAALRGAGGMFDARLAAFERANQATPASPTGLGCLEAAADALQLNDPERAARALRVALGAGAPAERLLPRLVELAARGARPEIGPLRLLWLLGEGGMGQVWAAEHRETGAKVAVKILRPNLVSPRMRALFLAEMGAVAQLDHPGIVRVLAARRLDVGESAMLGLEAGAPALVMEQVDGGALDQGGRAWRWSSLKKLLLDLLDALGHAHARGVLHLDVKPANVLFDGGSDARLVDFGLAGLVSSTPGQVLGTPAYMSPEHSRGQDLGPWTDLYAVGVTAWEVATGERPFESPDVRTLLDLHRHAPLPPFRARFPVPGGFDAWLEGLLAKSSASRFQRAADAAFALRALGDPDEDGANDEELVLDEVSTFPTSLPRATTQVVQFDVHAPPPPPGGPAPAPAPFPLARTDARQPTRPFLPGLGEGLVDLRVPRVRGRDAERALLWARLGTVHRTRVGRAIAVVGPPGRGRSRLADWLAEEAHATGAASVVRVTHRPGSDEAEAAHAALRVVRASDPRRATLVLVEDADAFPRLPGLVAALLDTGALVLLTARHAPTGVPVEEMALGPLTGPDIMAILDDLLPLERALATAIAARAGGAPAFAVALLGDLVGRGAVIPGSEGFRLRPGEQVALSAGDLATLAWGVDAAAPPGSPGRAALELAAVGGPLATRADWDAACAAAGLSEAPGALAALVDRGWLALGDTVSVPDGALAEALVDGATSAGRAAVWHGVWADVLRDRDDVQGPRGRHLALAGRPTEALAPLRAGAADAVNAVRLVECRELLDLWDQAADAAGIASDDPRRASPLVVRSFLAFHLGEDEVAPLDRALALVSGRDPVEEARIWYSMGSAMLHAERPADADQAFRRALALQDDPASMVPGLSLVGLASATFGQGRDGSAYVDAARARFTPGFAALAARCDVIAGRGLLRIGRREEARDALLRAEGVAKREGWVLDEAEVLCDLARIAQADGDAGAAGARLRRARDLLRAAGSDRQFEVEAELAELYVATGRKGDAKELCEAVLSRFGWRLAPSVRARLDRVARAAGRG